LPRRLKHYRNVSLLVNFIKSAIFIYVELDILYNNKGRTEDDIANYAIYAVEGILIQPLLIAAYIFVYRKQAAYNKVLVLKYRD
jgi:hypothetical protein